MERVVDGVSVYGVDVDAETRCRHYDDPRDVVAIQFYCCGRYYPCFRCHEAVTDHDPEVWPATSLDRRAVLCGACGTETRIENYLGVVSCPTCGTGFNPGCRHHYDRYFAVEGDG